MRKLSDVKGEDALNLIVDLIDPISEICADKALVTLLRKKDNLNAIKLGIKSHSKSVLKILALVDGKDVDTFEPSVIEIPKMLLEVLNDPEVTSLFQSQVQSSEKTLYGLATESTKAEEK